MAKMTAHGSTILESFEVPFGKFSLRSDGKILRQHRIDGRLEGAAIAATIKADRDFRTAFAKYRTKMGG